MGEPERVQEVFKQRSQARGVTVQGWKLDLMILISLF